MKECSDGDHVPSRLSIDQHAKLLKERAAKFNVRMTDEQARRAAEILLRKERLIGRPGLRGLREKTKTIEKKKEN